MFGLTWNQVRTTRVVSKCQKRCSDHFDTIIQYFETKTEQSNSESWHRCFVQNLSLRSIGQFEHGCVTCNKEEDLRRFSVGVWIHTLLISSYISEQFNATLEEKHINPTLPRQRVVTERLRRAHLSRWKLTRHALDHSILVGSGWQERQERDTCGVLYGRESNVHRSLSREGLRRDEAQDCSVQSQSENTTEHSVLV